MCEFIKISTAIILTLVSGCATVKSTPPGAKVYVKDNCVGRFEYKGDTPLYTAIYCGKGISTAYVVWEDGVESTIKQDTAYPFSGWHFYFDKEIDTNANVLQGSLERLYNENSQPLEIQHSENVTELNVESGRKETHQPELKKITIRSETKATPKSFSEPIDFGKYHALVIGIDVYEQLPNLVTACYDARKVAETLEHDYGFSVKLILNPSRADLLGELYELRNLLSKHDNLLVYYAGHGWLDNDADEGYWLPVDAAPDSQVNWISNASITTNIRAMEAKHVLVVADSCYSGKLTRGIHIRTRTPNYLNSISQKKARMVLSSGGLEPVWDSGGVGGHSVFASAFIEALRSNSGILDGTSLFTIIRERVGWNAQQTPEYAVIHKAGHEGGDFLFVRKR
jgi:hypothetical protein